MSNTRTDPVGLRSDLFPNLNKKFILNEYSGLPKLIKAYIAVVAESTLKHFRTIKNLQKNYLNHFEIINFSEMTTNTNYMGKLRVRLDSS